MLYTKFKNVRFSHCDPAGIVFYPRYAELCNEVVEDWFRESMQVDFHQLHEKLRVGVPAVHFEVDFIRPSTYGDVLEFTLCVKEMGKSSLSLEIVARNKADGQERVRFKLKVVMMSMDTMRAVPITDEWRSKFAAFQQ